MNRMEILAIGAAEMERHDCLPAIIAALHDAFAELHAGGVLMPPRTILAPGDPGDGRQLVVMPAALPRQQAAAVKLTTLTPANPARGLPLIHGLLMLADLATGQVVALMDGAEVTALRTGAGSGLATRLLARDDARALAVIGAGVQARTQLAAVAAVRPIDTVLIHSRTPGHAETFAAWARSRHGTLRVRVCATVREAVEAADVVCTATATGSAEPLVRSEWIRPGTHLNAVGGVDENACELAPALLATARVVVEDRRAALDEAGEVRAVVAANALAPGDVVELGAVVAGAAPGRRSPEEVTVYRSVGIALQDVAAARAIFQRVRAAGGGTTVTL
ncbi:MAG TPA: ornithine cyclodeaminase family protein [Longimicrobium sp.]|nr:ornithine cyclodeaminase family protein [Longimicrobium sp.]